MSDPNVTAKDRSEIMQAIVDAVRGTGRIPHDLHGSLWSLTRDDLDQAFAEGFQMLVDDGEAGAEPYLNPVLRADLIDALLNAAARPDSDRSDVSRAATDFMSDVLGDADDDAEVEQLVSAYVARKLN